MNDANDDSNYKSRQEAFVSNLSGTTKEELVLVISIFPIAVLLSALVSTALRLKLPRSWRRFSIEFVCVVLPVLASMTIAADGSWKAQFSFWLPFSLAAASTAVLLRRQQGVVEEEDEFVADHVAGHITAMRSGLMMMTCIAILGVDFQIFPRRFAKTETFGTGLMDIGVGGFVIANAVVLGLNDTYAKLRVTFSKTLSSTGLLVMIGLLRLALVKSVDYQEHVSEYGLHWNFFFTLAAVSLFSSLLFGKILPLPLSQRPGVMGVALLTGHHFILKEAGVENWVLHGPRIDLISQNKEGVASILGYLSLFSMGVWLGRKHVPRIGEVTLDRSFVTRQVGLFIVLFYGTSIMERWAGPISRRLANPSYIMWTLAITQMLLVQILILQAILPSPVRVDSSPAALLEAVNFNQLFVFLIANLLTGLCNQLVRTLDANTSESFGCLVIYLIVVHATAFALYRGRKRLHPMLSLQSIVHSFLKSH